MGYPKEFDLDSAKDKSYVRLTKVETLVESKVPDGYSCCGVFYKASKPTVGQPFRVGGFTTGVVTRITGDKVFTEKSVFKIDDPGDDFEAPRFAKVNSIFDDLEFDDKKPGFGLMDEADTGTISEKLTAAHHLAGGKRDMQKILENFLPTLTVTEMAMMVGLLIGKFHQETSGMEGGGPDMSKLTPEKLEEIKELLRRLKGGGNN